MPATSGAAALSLLQELTLRDRSVALVVSDQRMPEMTGIEMLAEVRQLSPETKLLLLTAYADTDVAIRAITTKDVGKGTGLGLDISRRIIVERHSGDISIDSRPGRTVMRVTLPVREQTVGG